MATIEINDDWRIASDPHCWMVQRRLWRKPSGETEKRWIWQSESYHADIAQAAASYGWLRLRQSDASGISEITNTLARVEAEIRAALACAPRSEVA